METQHNQAYQASEPYHGFDKIKMLVDLFITKKLPHEQWNHEAHLTVGLWFLCYFTAEESIDILRDKIKSYNESVGVKNTDSSGYHETITLFWVWVIKNFITINPGRGIHELQWKLLNSKYASRDLALKFYSKEHLFSAEGRTQFVLPDKNELDFLSI